MLSLWFTACGFATLPAARPEPAPPVHARPVAEALEATCGPRLPAKGTATGLPLKVVTVAESPARCNDGSPPAMYVRAGQGEHVADWVLVMEGGAFCVDYPTCMARWCSYGPFDATRMSTRFDAPTAGANGILASRPDNAFADWNVVKLRYCSSDAWLGRADAPVVLDGRLGSFSLRMEGARILESLLVRLDEGARSDDGTVELPRLSRAARIVLVGESAGALGAIHHVDAVAARYPEAHVVGVIDGGVEPDPALAPANVPHRTAEQSERFQRDVVVGLWHAAPPPACPDCRGTHELVYRGEKTPLVVRQDLLDPFVSKLARSENGVTLDGYARSAEVTLRALAERRPDVTVLGSRCAEHVAAGSVSYYAPVVREGGAGDPLSLQQAVEDLVLRGQRHVAIEAASATPLDCPGTNTGRRR